SSLLSPELDAKGRTAFMGYLTGSGVVLTANSHGIWSEGTGTLTLVAREGSQAPGTDSGVNFSVLDGVPGLNSVGQTAFSAPLAGSGVNTSNDRGIWETDRYGVLRLIVREGDKLEVAPGDFRTVKGLGFDPS